VALLIAGIALAVPNMGWAFGIGIAADLFIRKMKVKIEEGLRSTPYTTRKEGRTRVWP